MDNQDTIVTHYAILIGIDAYPNRPLTSCVHDVLEIKNYLIKELLKSVHIQIFTAAKSTDLKSCNPAEDSVLWPTYDNVTAAFRKVTSLARAGDFVYIHYSGHGTRMEPLSEFSNESTGDLALVLLRGEKENREPYLRGWILAHLLKAMVDKGLVVTLVLDCCFSAAVYRDDDDPTIRFLPYDAEVDSKYPLSLETLSLEKSPEYGADRPANRDASMLPNWLINPDAYAILVACGPHEFAKGVTSDVRNHGALSYFLLRAFTECDGLRKKHRNIYQHLCAGFRKSGPQQNPVLYGNKDQGFFGHTISGIDINLISIIERDGSLQLQAGQAHGVCDHDRFTVRPLGSVESNSSSKGDPVIAEVTQARALTSLPHPDEWLAALKARSLDVHFDIDQHPYLFHALLNNCKENEILDDSDHKIINLPTMSHHQMDVSSICDVLEHLVRYKLVRDLANQAPADAFMESFKVQIICRSGEIFDPECVVEVEEDEKAKFTFELQVGNKRNNALYVSIYDMGPCWQVQNIFHGSYAVVPTRDNEEGFTGVYRKKLKTMVPQEMREKGHRQCQDIIKVFVTSRPTSFDLLEIADRIYEENSDIPEEWAALNFPIRTSLK
ncbi:hypothetical protein MMC22_008916 [Lobaria immixta]|nr:hypothetical protein [Lobaria immixta]